MKHTNLQRALLGLTLAAASALAQADVLGFDQRADFNAAGHIAVTSNFDDFGRGYHFPGSDFSLHQSHDIGVNVDLEFHHDVRRSCIAL